MRRSGSPRRLRSRLPARRRADGTVAGAARLRPGSGNVGWAIRWGVRDEYGADVRGDRVEIVIDAGDEVRTYEIEATRNGRRVEIETGRGMVTVTEVTRGGTPVRTARFMSNRILALVEHPAADANIARDLPDLRP